MSAFEIENGVLKGYSGSDEEIVIPNEVKQIFSVPFCDCWDPFTLTLSENMECSFNDILSQGITILNIPAGTKFKCSPCGPNHSSFFAQLREINVDPANTSCASKDGILYSKDMSILYGCPAAHDGSVVIPETVKVIGTHAFDGCKKLTEIVIPETVTEIGERAFMDCSGLKKIVLLTNDAVIGPEAFLRCAKITNAGEKGTVKGKGYSFEFVWTKEIPENAFSGLNKLKKVVLPETVKTIGKNAFKGCKGLEDIKLPENVKVDKKAFKDCKNLSV